MEHLFHFGQMIVDQLAHRLVIFGACRQAIGLITPVPGQVIPVTIGQSRRTAFDHARHVLLSLPGDFLPNEPFPAVGAMQRWVINQRLLVDDPLQHGIHQNIDVLGGDTPLFVVSTQLDKYVLFKHFQKR
ncbi:hypothetical protein D9M71_351520 [compost metagenome]